MMADVIPNYSLELMAAELERAQLALNMQSQQYRIAQTHDEVARINTNIEATRTALVALDLKIKSLKG